MLLFVLILETGQLALILVFATGLDQVPPLGLDPEGSLHFIHDDSLFYKGLPRANTCSNMIYIPIVCDYNEFKNNMLSALEMVTTFSTQ